jgi:lysozyme
MKTSEAGLHLMHKFEGYKNKPYLCPAHIWSVGWGTVLYQDQIKLPMIRVEGKDVPMIRKEYPLRQEDNRVWSKEELVEIFKNDLASFERAVLRLVPGCAGHQGRFDALVCLAYNIGAGNLQRSTIRMKANRGDWEGAEEAFMAWTKGGGKVLPGLVKRRVAEKALFLSD